MTHGMLPLPRHLECSIRANQSATRQSHLTHSEEWRPHELPVDDLHQREVLGRLARRPGGRT